MSFLLKILAVSLLAASLSGCGAARRVKIGSVSFVNCKITEQVVVNDHGQQTEYRSCDCPNGVLMWDAKKKQKVVKCGSY